MKRKEPSLIWKPLLPALLSLSWPAMLAMLFQSLSRLTDVFFLGVIGTNAQAAIGIFEAIEMYLMFYNSSIGSGSIGLISQSFGKGNYQIAGKITAQTLSLKFFGSFIFTIPTLFLLRPLAILLGAEGPTVDLVVLYGSIMCYVIPLQNTGFTFNTALRAAGDALTPMYLMLSQLIINIGLNTLFILGIGPFPSMGIVGVAVAAGVSQLFLFIAGMYLYMSKKCILSFSLRDFLVPDFYYMKKIIQIGLPKGYQQIVLGIANSIIVKRVSIFGMSSLAIFTVVKRISRFIVMPVSGLSFATSTLVGQNMGASKPKRCINATLYASYVALIITIVFFILIAIFPRNVLAVFSSDPVVLSSGIWPLLVFAFNQILFAQSIIFDAPLLGTGYLKIGFYVRSISTWLFQIPMIYFLPLHFGLNGIWYAFTIFVLVDFLMIFTVFKKQKWMQRVV